MRHFVFDDKYSLRAGIKLLSQAIIVSFIWFNGVSIDSVEVVSYGEENPASSGTSEESHSLNRRVEIVFSNTGN